MRLLELLAILAVSATMLYGISKIPPLTPAPPPVVVRPLPTIRADEVLKLINGDYLGSGFVADRAEEDEKGVFKHLIVTSKHFTEGVSPKGFSIYCEGEYFGDAHIWKHHPTEDVALLILETYKELSVCKLSSEIPEFGDNSFLLGYPFGEGPFIREGLFSNKGEMSTPTWGGDSGGPVFNMRGHVVGFTVSVLHDETGIFSSAASMVMYSDFCQWYEKETVEWRAQLIK